MYLNGDKFGEFKSVDYNEVVTVTGWTITSFYCIDMLDSKTKKRASQCVAEITLFHMASVYTYL
jgi:hypothetical protein